jgi:hypothetical protein
MTASSRLPGVGGYAGRHPRSLREEDVNAFLSDLAVTRKVAASTQNQALAAVL